ncbi:MAG: hypothetical protein ABII22_03240, partial [Candidatus Micrarchaeota archaeon]
DGGANTTLVGCANTTITPGEARHTILFYTNDSANNVNTSSNLTFTIDLTAPSLTVESPIATTYTSTLVPLSFTALDPGVGVNSCWYSFDNGVTNVSLPLCANTTLSVVQGQHSLRVYANDTFNHVNTSNSINFIVSIPVKKVDPEPGQTGRLSYLNFQTYSNCMAEETKIKVTSGSTPVSGVKIRLFYTGMSNLEYTQIGEQYTDDSGMVMFRTKNTGNYEFFSSKSGFRAGSSDFYFESCQFKEDVVNDTILEELNITIEAPQPLNETPLELIVEDKDLEVANTGKIATYRITGEMYENTTIVDLSFVPENDFEGTVLASLGVNYSYYEDDTINIYSSEGEPTKVVKGSIIAYWDDLQLLANEEFKARFVSYMRLSPAEILSARIDFINKQDLSNNIRINQNLEIKGDSEVLDSKQGKNGVIELGPVYMFIVGILVLTFVSAIIISIVFMIFKKK